MANPDVIDHNKLTTEIQFVMPTKGLKPGYSVMGGIPPSYLKECMGVQDIDCLIPTKIGAHVVTHNSKEKAGVNFYHGSDLNTNVPLATPASSFILAPHPNGRDHPSNHLEDGSNPDITESTYKGPLHSTSYHVISTGYRIPVEKILPLTYDEADMQEGLNKAAKRQADRWHLTKEENIAAGSYNETIDGENHVAVFPCNEEGVENAVHKYIERVGDMEDSYDGRYSTGARTPIRHKELTQPGFLMREADHKHAVDTMRNMLSSTNPFKDGLHAHVTNLGTKAMTESTTVHVTMHRNPITYGDGSATVGMEQEPVIMPVTRDIIDSSLRTENGELPSTLPVLKNPEPFQLDKTA